MANYVNFNVFISPKLITSNREKFESRFNFIRVKSNDDEKRGIASN